MRGTRSGSGGCFSSDTTTGEIESSSPRANSCRLEIQNSLENISENRKYFSNLHLFFIINKTYPSFMAQNYREYECKQRRFLNKFLPPKYVYPKCKVSSIICVDFVICHFLNVKFSFTGNITSTAPGFSQHLLYNLGRYKIIPSQPASH